MDELSTNFSILDLFELESKVFSCQSDENTLGGLGANLVCGIWSDSEAGPHV